jgi:pyrimidine-nucleoside phosphorylase
VNTVQIICKKRDGQPLTQEEIAFVVQGYSRGSIPDYQMSALAMAIFLNGMDPTETAWLTEQMLSSGQRLSWQASGRACVDKHSSGGIGDKVSLILAPLLACCDLRVPMISGRGLGATGGTLDKLESIPGVRTDLSLAEMQRITDQVGCVITGATEQLAPADRQLYALRDVTGTVPSIPLITASIMSKKLAEGLDALVLDVKCGSGAFMKRLAEARQLADSLVSVGRQMGLNTSALITDMNQPLGRMVGNTVEVDESLATLSGRGPEDLVHITCQLAGELLRLTGRSAEREDGARRARALLESGQAREKFDEMIAAQGGDMGAPRETAPETIVRSHEEGYLWAIDAEQLGLAVIEMGGGRRVKEHQIDHAVGFEMQVRIGDRVERNQALARLFSRPATTLIAENLIRSAIHIHDHPVTPPQLVLDEAAA